MNWIAKWVRSWDLETLWCRWFGHATPRELSLDHGNYYCWLCGRRFGMRTGNSR